MSTLTRQEDIFILSIERVFSLEAIEIINQHLNTVESTPGPKALIFTGLDPNIFSAGMDLKKPYELNLIFTSLVRLSQRLLSSGVPSIAAINGHCMAGGLILAMACDYRIMVNRNAKVAMTEIKIGMILPEQGSAILKVKLPHASFRDLILTG